MNTHTDVESCCLERWLDQFYRPAAELTKRCSPHVYLEASYGREQAGSIWSAGFRVPTHVHAQGADLGGDNDKMDGAEEAAAGGRRLEDDVVEVWHTSESPSRLSPVTGTSADSNSLADERAHEDQRERYRNRVYRKMTNSRFCTNLKFQVYRNPVLHICRLVRRAKRGFSRLNNFSVLYRTDSLYSIYPNNSLVCPALYTTSVLAY